MNKFEELSSDQQQPYIDNAAKCLSDLYSCGRVWEAWQYGTMGRDDFELACENDEIVFELASDMYIFHQKKEDQQ